MNFKPNTLWINDNLPVLRGMDSGTVDLAVGAARIALGLLTVLVSAAIYFLPALVAVARNVQVNRAFGVLILNLFLGWTLIGWVAALVWAVVEPAAQSKEGFRDA